MLKALVLSLAGIMKGYRFINGKEMLTGVFSAVVWDQRNQLYI